jgi:hypothetical protein
VSELPEPIREALAERPHTLEQLLPISDVRGSQLLGALRAAERDGVIRFARGMYEMTGPPPIALRSTAETAAAETKPAISETKVHQPETITPIRATKPVIPATIKAPEEPAMAKSETRECKACHDTKPLDTKNFSRNNSCPGGFESRCNDCKAAGRYIDRGGASAAKKSAKAKTATARVTTSPDDLHIPAQAELKARLKDGREVHISQGGAAPICITFVQMQQFFDWWQSKRSGAET